jgi:hypothetical protein
MKDFPNERFVVTQDFTFDTSRSGELPIEAFS